MEKKCAYCGMVFEGDRITAKYCSTQCKWDYHNKKDAKHPWSKDLLNKCVICGVLFNPPKECTNKKICSKMCQIVMNNKRITKWQKENRDKCKLTLKKYYYKCKELGIKKYVDKERARQIQYKYNRTEKAKIRLERYKLKHPDRIKAAKKKHRASEKYRQTKARYKLEHPITYKLKQIRNNFRRRQLLKGQSWEISKSQLNQIYNRQNQLYCIYCGKKDKLTIDHVVSIANGGRNEVDNLVLCCSKCNSSKQHKDVFVWCKDKGFEVPKLVLELLEKQQKQLELTVFN